MKYFLDTEFIEGKQHYSLFSNNTIDLISIGVVCEDGREYYAISKDFNIKEAWNRYDIKSMTNLPSDTGTNKMKVYWLKDNVLKPIFDELVKKERSYYIEMFKRINVWTKYIDDDYYKFTYKEFKRLIKKYGKTNKQIAEEIKEFVYKASDLSNQSKENQIKYWGKEVPIQFYGYYSDYDWVVFCWLFGRMIDLPKGFPMYCIDLKQTLDEKNSKNIIGIINQIHSNDLSKHCNYPKQINEHNALADAKWNYELYKFLNTL